MKMDPDVDWNIHEIEDITPLEREIYSDIIKKIKKQIINNKK